MNIIFIKLSGKFSSLLGYHVYFWLTYDTRIIFDTISVHVVSGVIFLS